MRGNPAEGSAAAADAIPREYNFASDLFDRFRSKGWLDRVAYIDQRGSWTVNVVCSFADRTAMLPRCA